MPSVGPLEILVVFVVALIVFGPQKLPELGRQLGKALREFQKVQDSFQHEVKQAFDVNEPPRAPAPPIPATDVVVPAGEPEPAVDTGEPAAATGRLGGFDRELPPVVQRDEAQDHADDPGSA
jgi:TatA/E family protein of Tat protein translocase